MGSPKITFHPFPLWLVGWIDSLDLKRMSSSCKQRHMLASSAILCTFICLLALCYSTQTPSIPGQTTWQSLWPILNLAVYLSQTLFRKHQCKPGPVLFLTDDHAAETSDRRSACAVSQKERRPPQCKALAGVEPDHFNVIYTPSCGRVEVISCSRTVCSSTSSKLLESWCLTKHIQFYYLKRGPHLRQIELVSKYLSAKQAHVSNYEMVFYSDSGHTCYVNHWVLTPKIHFRQNHWFLTKVKEAFIPSKL